MRLWTLHPRYLDPQGLVALWREALLARAVLRGRTRGYRNHPQLLRFRAAPGPVATLNAYLAAVYAESLRRGYQFDPRKLGCHRGVEPLAESRGQLALEWEHLRAKLGRRSPRWFKSASGVRHPEAHPLFRIVPGPVASWERAVSPDADRRPTSPGRP